VWGVFKLGGGYESVLFFFDSDRGDAGCYFDSTYNRFNLGMVGVGDGGYFH